MLLTFLKLQIVQSITYSKSPPHHSYLEPLHSNHTPRPWMKVFQSDTYTYYTKKRYIDVLPFFCIFFEILVKYKSFLKTQINWSCARYLSKNITCWYFHYYCNVPLLLININWSLPGERVLIDLCSKKFKENSFLPIQHLLVQSYKCKPD